MRNLLHLISLLCFYLSSLIWTHPIFADPLSLSEPEPPIIDGFCFPDVLRPEFDFFSINHPVSTNSSDHPHLEKKGLYHQTQRKSPFEHLEPLPLFVESQYIYRTGTQTVCLGAPHKIIPAEPDSGLLSLEQALESLRPYVEEGLPYLEQPIIMFSVSAEAARKFLEANGSPIPASLIGIAGSSSKILLHYFSGQRISLTQLLTLFENSLLYYEAKNDLAAKAALEIEDILGEIAAKAAVTRQAAARHAGTFSAQATPETLPASSIGTPQGQRLDFSFHPSPEGSPTAPHLALRPLGVASRPFTTSSPDSPGSGVSRRPPPLSIPQRTEPVEAATSLYEYAAQVNVETAAIMVLQAAAAAQLAKTVSSLRVVRYTIKLLLTGLGESTAIAREYPTASAAEVLLSPLSPLTQTDDAIPGLAARSLAAMANTGNNLFKCLKIPHLIAGVAGFRGGYKAAILIQNLTSSDELHWSDPAALKEASLSIILIAQAPLNVLAQTTRRRLTLASLLALEVLAGAYTFMIPFVHYWPGSDSTT